MSNKKITENRHPLVRVLTFLLGMEIALIVVLSVVKALIPPVFYPVFRDVAFWDVMAIVATIIIYASAFPNDLEEDKDP